MRVEEMFSLFPWQTSEDKEDEFLPDNCCCCQALRGTDWTSETGGEEPLSKYIFK